MRFYHCTGREAADSILSYHGFENEDLEDLYQGVWISDHPLHVFGPVCLAIDGIDEATMIEHAWVGPSGGHREFLVQAEFLNERGQVTEITNGELADREVEDPP